MKTTAEIMIEAQRLEALAEKQRADFRQNEVAIRERLAAAQVDPFPPDPDHLPSGRRSPLVGLLTTLPQVVVHAREGMDGDPQTIRRYRIVREIEVALDSEPAEYRLREERFELMTADRVVAIFGSYVAMVGDSVRGMLEEGYERNVQDEMMERLFPILDSLDERENNEVTPEEIAEVEKRLELPPLSPAERLRARAEIADFLDGRLKAGDFIAHAIDWQSVGQGEREAVAERRGIRILMDEP